MTPARFPYVSLILAVVAVLPGCVTTTMRSVQREPEFHSQQLRRVMVLYLGQNQDLRKAVEHEFVRQWRKRGVDVTPSLTALPAGTVLEKTQVAPIVKAQNYDSVLIVRVQGTQSLDARSGGDGFDASASTGPAQGFSEYYNAVVASPAYSENYRMAVVTANLYHVPTEKRIWSGTSQTIIADDVSKLVTPYVKVVLDALYQTP